MNTDRQFWKRLTACVCACVAFALTIAADVQITLFSGQTISGNILFENEEVIVIKDADGVRYQYLKTEIMNVETDAPITESPKQPVAETKKVTAILQLSGGGTLMPDMQWGSRFAGDLRVGACNVTGKHIFLGGGIGYHAYVTQETTYSFIPLQLNMDIPFVQGKHAPYAGLALGYGFAVTQSLKGGLYTGIDIGWRYAISLKTTLLLSMSAAFQQCTLDIIETIDETPYTKTTTQGLCTIGAKLAFSF